jgi:hypothetical protein
MLLLLIDLIKLLDQIIADYLSWNHTKKHHHHHHVSKSKHTPMPHTKKEKNSMKSETPAPKKNLVIVVAKARFK